MPTDSNLTDRQFRNAADRLHGADGECEIDDGATVSRNYREGGGDGAYVHAWVWVPNDEASKEENK